MKRSLVVLSSLVFTLLLFVLAARTAVANNVVYFSAGWKPTAGIPGNIVEFGVVYPCDLGWCADYELFDGRDNLPTVPTSRIHEMYGPRPKLGCVDRPMDTVSGVARAMEPVKVDRITDGYDVTTKDRTFRWRTTGRMPDGRTELELKKLIERKTGKSATQVVGLAFTAPATAAITSLKSLAGKYDGVIYHKDMNATPEDPWVKRRSIIDFSKFIPNKGDPSVEGFVAPGHPDVIKRVGKQLWVRHSITILPQITAKLVPLLHEYGHDFNDDGCFDEPGHNKLLLPVIVGGQVSELVYVEYTPDLRDPRDRVPMVSVGAYFKTIMNVSRQ